MKDWQSSILKQAGNYNRMPLSAPSLISLHLCFDYLHRNLSQFSRRVGKRGPIAPQ